MSKIAPPMALMPYITFENGEVVAEKPIPWFLKPAFKKYCERIKREKERKQKMIDKIIS